MRGYPLECPGPNLIRPRQHGPAIASLARLVDARSTASPMNLLSAGFASSRRLLLYGLYRSTHNPRRASFIVTTAAEAMEGLNHHRPGVLILTPKLEQGDRLALAKQARCAYLIDQIQRSGTKCCRPCEWRLAHRYASGC